MREIEKMATHAMLNRESFRKSNTEVVYDKYTKTSTVYLHGNPIFTWKPDTCEWSVDDCGWTSSTTRSRVNACFKAIGGRFTMKQKAGEHWVFDNTTCRGVKTGRITGLA